MREFVGHKLKVTVEHLGEVEGVAINENKVFLFLKVVQDGSERVMRIPKGKICAFTPMDAEPEDYVPFHVLYCDNKTLGCPGVQYIQEGPGFNPADLEVFMSPCECRVDGCRCGTKGELRTVKGDTLRRMFKDILFGDYPKKKEAPSAGRTRADEAAGSRKDESGRAGEGEVSPDRGTGSDEEASEGS